MTIQKIFAEFIRPFLKIGNLGNLTLTDKQKNIITNVREKNLKDEKLFIEHVKKVGGQISPWGINLS